MKNKVLTVVLLFIFISSFSQVDSTSSKLKIGAKFNAHLISDINYSFQASLYYKKHFLSLGPIFGEINPSHIDNNNKNTEVNGLLVSYQFFPNFNNKIFNLFFSANYAYLSYKYNQKIYYYSNLSEKFNGFSIGFGFDIVFLKHFYYDTSFSMGVGYDKGINYQNIEYENRDVHMMLKSGIGFNF